jgi:hypothetical protein
MVVLSDGDIFKNQVAADGRPTRWGLIITLQKITVTKTSCLTWPIT